MGGGEGARGNGPVARGRHATLFPDPAASSLQNLPSWGPPSLPGWLALETLFLAPLRPLIASPLLPPPRGRTPQTKGI